MFGLRAPINASIRTYEATVVLALAVGCGGKVEQTDFVVIDGDGGTFSRTAVEPSTNGGLGGDSFTGDSGTAPVSRGTVTEVCAQPTEEMGMPPLSTCSTVVLDCALGLKGDCLSTPWSSTLGVVAENAGAYCGEFWVGVSKGCVTTVSFNSVVSGVGRSSSEIESRIERNILGQRWDCSPSDGWQRVFLGSCTLQ